MEKRIVFLPPDNTSLMRYIYLKLCISSPWQGLQEGPRVALRVCFGLAGVRTARPVVWLALAAPGLPAASLSAALTIALCALAPSHHSDLSTALKPLVLTLPPTSSASRLRAFLASTYLVPGPQHTSHPPMAVAAIAIIAGASDLTQSPRTRPGLFPPTLLQLTSRLHLNAGLSTSVHMFSVSVFTGPGPGCRTRDRAVTQTARSCREVD